MLQDKYQSCCLSILLTAHFDNDFPLLNRTNVNTQGFSVSVVSLGIMHSTQILQKLKATISANHKNFDILQN